MLPDVRTMTPDARARAAWRVHESPDFALPELPHFNSSPCPAHDVLHPGCMKCGVQLRSYQRVGAAWMFLGGRNLLADTMGSGKTIQAAALLAMCRQTGELSLDDRAVVVCRAAAVGQWAAQLRRLLPGVPVISAGGGDPSQRTRGYLSPWEVCVVSDRTFAPSRALKDPSRSRDGDLEQLCQFPVSTLFYDDLDAMRNPRTQTAYAVSRLAGQCGRVHGLHGTPLQKRLAELHSFLVPVGGLQVFGTETRFRQRFVKSVSRTFYVPDKRDPAGRRKKLRTVVKDVGVKEHNLPEFQRLLRPMVLRRTAADLDGAGLPDVVANPVWVELSVAQRARYDELKKGILVRLRDAGREVTRAEAGVAFTRGAQICSGLAALDDGRDISAKLDWAVDKITGDLDGEKAVVFVYFTPNVAALASRLKAEGVGSVLMWSLETSKEERARRIARFTSDPGCRVLIGTSTIEMSLNLQAARHLIAVDTILNPARMAQLVGRVRRLGSVHHSVFFHHLLSPGTQEAAYLSVLGQEQGMADSVWGEQSDIFEQLTPRQVLEMVAGAS
jgi:SNF2 family DNA or RNA helicase